MEYGNFNDKARISSPRTSTPFSRWNKKHPVGHPTRRGRWSRQTSTVHWRLWAKWRDTTRPKQHFQKSWQTSTGQNNAQQFLGQVWTAIQQASSQSFYFASQILGLTPRRFPRHSQRAHRQQRNVGSGAQPSARMRPGANQHQHLHRLLHDLLCTPQNCIGHSKRYNHNKPSTLTQIPSFTRGNRASQNFPWAIISEIHQWTWCRWSHRGICGGRPQVLWIQDTQGENRMQSLPLQS